MGNAIARVDVTTLTPAGFRERYQKPGLPVIIQGCLTQEGDWHLDFLCQQLGQQEFLLRRYGQARYQQDKREWTSIGSGVELHTMPFNRYAELLRDKTAHTEDIYLAKCPLQSTALAQMPVSQVLQSRLGLTRSATGLNLWVGPGGHVECLHYDPMDGTLMQLHGTKKVVMFPPSQTKNLYPFPISVHLRHGLQLRTWFSQVYPERPDIEVFPKLQTALEHKVEVLLQPGELLFIPTGWWHEITALGDEMVCSVNQFWRVYPTRRAVFNWPRWRAYCGSACAVPHTIGQLILALISRDRSTAVSKILRRL